MKIFNNALQSTSFGIGTRVGASEFNTRRAKSTQELSEDAFSKESQDAHFSSTNIAPIELSEDAFCEEPQDADFSSANINLASLKNLKAVNGDTNFEHVGNINLEKLDTIG